MVPDARGLDPEQMQRIAREFGFSETTFVLPARAGHTRRVRIFTPSHEIPFAGHPNLGTAWVLAHEGALGELASPARVVFEEDAGLVPVEIAVSDGRPGRCELSAPSPLRIGEALPVERMAAAARLPVDDFVTATHPPVEASVGLPFLFAELRDRDALARARADVAVLEELGLKGAATGLYLYAADAPEGFDVQSRMFAPLGGVPEDPATGSAACALAALRASCSGADARLAIAQGVEMGRPSALFATAVRGGDGIGARVAGDCVWVAEGTIDAGEAR